jgi:hypothetical protein
MKIEIDFLGRLRGGFWLSSVPFYHQIDDCHGGAKWGEWLCVSSILGVNTYYIFLNGPIKSERGDLIGVFITKFREAMVV